MSTFFCCCSLNVYLEKSSSLVPKGQKAGSNHLHELMNHSDIVRSAAIHTNMSDSSWPRPWYTSSGTLPNSHFKGAVKGCTYKLSPVSEAGTSNLAWLKSSLSHLPQQVFQLFPWLLITAPHYPAKSPKQGHSIIILYLDGSQFHWPEEFTQQTTSGICHNSSFYCHFLSFTS